MTAWLRLSLLFACCAAALGCGGGETDPLDDPSTFAGMFRAQIQESCTKLSDCRQQTDMAAGPSWVEKCVRDTADTVNDNPANQQSFVTRFTRCKAQPNCPYADCFMRLPAYALTQLPKIEQSCTADIMCKQEQGMKFDAEIANNVCIGLRLGTLDTYSPDTRAAYQNAYAPCAMLTSCMFTSCFPY